MVGKTDSKQKNIRAFIDEFDGDYEAAIAAIRSYHSDVWHRKNVPLPRGDVLISVKDVTKNYKVNKTTVKALDGVSLDIYKGEFVALTGTSGSGKSTLLQLLGGLDRPSSGTVSLDGTDLGRLKDAKLSEFRNATIGFVFQFFYLQPFLRLDQNISVPGMFAGVPRRARKEKVFELAEAVGLKDRIAHLPKELSGGQMQRAAIARALLNNPKIVLADEPTGNLDSANTNAIMELFATIRKTYGTTIVMVTHDQSLAARADREITLRDGRIV